jgi:hypothetical protein
MLQLMGATPAYSATYLRVSWGHLPQRVSASVDKATVSLTVRALRYVEMGCL